jgi:hypothetical protein
MKYGKTSDVELLRQGNTSLVDLLPFKSLESKASEPG